MTRCRTILKATGWCLMGAALVVTLAHLGTPGMPLTTAPGRIGDFLQRAWPPDFSDWKVLLVALWSTIAMALWGTILSTLLSLPLSLCAAASFVPRPIALMFGALMDVIRTVPSLVWALLFVAAIGLGPASGVAALACYSTGYLSRMYLDDFESLDMSVFRALRLSGASRLQAFQYGLLPQAKALIASNTLFILEYNIRTATILGIVGAGGVGYYLYLFMQQMDYQKATALLIFLVPVVSLLANLSHRVRKSLMTAR